MYPMLLIILDVIWLIGVIVIAAMAPPSSHLYLTTGVAVFIIGFLLQRDCARYQGARND